MTLLWSRAAGAGRQYAPAALIWRFCAAAQLDRQAPRLVVRIGLISDTHSLLRPEAIAFLRGCNHIIHGGDIGSPSVLDELAALAPLTAVRGNNDKGTWAEALPATELVKFDQVFAYVIHDLAELDIDPQAAGVGVITSGHSHQPLIEEREGVLYINPGSAGPRRFKLPIAVAELNIMGKSAQARIVELISDRGA